jgi:hypothetical protein
VVGVRLLLNVGCKRCQDVTVLSRQWKTSLQGRPPFKLMVIQCDASLLRAPNPHRAKGKTSVFVVAGVYEVPAVIHGFADSALFCLSLRCLVLQH